MNPFLFVEAMPFRYITIQEKQEGVVVLQARPNQPKAIRNGVVSVWLVRLEGELLLHEWSWFAKGCQTQLLLKWRKQTVSRFHLRQKYYLK